jgi:HAD superfamily hydrolase (TIGR01509 family)
MSDKRKRRKGVIFDLDGVLVDSEPLHVEAWQVLFDKQGMQITEEEYRHGIGMTDTDWIAYLFERRGQETDPDWWQAEKRKVYRGVLAAKGKPFAGVVRLVRRLRQEQFALGVASNSWRENIECVLEAADLRDCFTALTGRENVTEPKPSPAPYLRTARAMGVAPKACVAIEDSDLGVRSAQRAGMRAIAVPNSLPPDRLQEADLVVPSLEQADVIVEFCRRNGRARPG